MLHLWLVNETVVLVFPKCYSTVLTSCFQDSGGVEISHRLAREAVFKLRLPVLLITRDPGERIVSTYLDKCVRNPDLPGTAEKFKQPKTFEDFCLRIATRAIVDEHILSHSLAVSLFFGPWTAARLLLLDRLKVIGSPREALLALGFKSRRVDQLLHTPTDHKISYKSDSNLYVGAVPTHVWLLESSFPLAASFFNHRTAEILVNLFRIDRELGLVNLSFRDQELY